MHNIYSYCVLLTGTTDKYIISTTDKVNKLHLHFKIIDYLIDQKPNSCFSLNFFYGKENLNLQKSRKDVQVLPC